MFTCTTVSRIFSFDVKDVKEKMKNNQTLVIEGIEEDDDQPPQP
jgi:hypothetical protein